MNRPRFARSLSNARQAGGGAAGHSVDVSKSAHIMECRPAARRRGADTRFAVLNPLIRLISAFSSRPYTTLPSAVPVSSGILLLSCSAMSFWSFQTSALTNCGNDSQAAPFKASTRFCESSYLTPVCLRRDQIDPVSNGARNTFGLPWRRRERGSHHPASVIERSLPVVRGGQRPKATIQISGLNGLMKAIRFNHLPFDHATWSFGNATPGGHY